jgi:hypothetical protein
MGVVMMVRSALTVQEKTEIWRGYEAGESLRSISRTLGRSMGTLRMLVASTGDLTKATAGLASARQELLDVLCGIGESDIDRGTRGGWPVRPSCGG